MKEFNSPSIAICESENKMFFEIQSFDVFQYLKTSKFQASKNILLSPPHITIDSRSNYFIFKALKRV